MSMHGYGDTVNGGDESLDEYRVINNCSDKYMQVHPMSLDDNNTSLAAHLVEGAPHMLTSFGGLLVIQIVYIFILCSASSRAAKQPYDQMEWMEVDAQICYKHL